MGGVRQPPSAQRDVRAERAVRDAAQEVERLLGLVR